jgi:hypothetical protein
MKSAHLRLTLCLGAALAIAGCGEDKPGGTDGSSAGRGGSGTGGSSGAGGSAGTGGSSSGTGGSSSTGGSSGGKGGSASTGGTGGSSTGGSGGSSGGTGGSGAMDTNAALPEAGSMTIRPLPAPPPKRQGFTVIHSTNVSVWESEDPDVYMQYKEGFDEIIDILERGYFGIEKRLGTGLKLPFRVIIEKGGCCGGWAGGGDVGYADGNFKDEGGLAWTRGVVIGEVVNNVTGSVTSEWPRDWWADTAWYFPGFVAVDVMKEVVPASATKWETDEKYPTYPVYVLYKALLSEQGWPLYQRLMKMVKDDKLDLSKVGANPSAIKTNYTVAYISLAAKTNLATRFMAAKVAADPAVVQAIMDAHEKLVQAGPTAPGWARFRTGNYQGL